MPANTKVGVGFCEWPTVARWDGYKPVLGLPAVRFGTAVGSSELTEFLERRGGRRGTGCPGPRRRPGRQVESRPRGPVIGEDQSSMSERRKRIPPVAAWASPPASSPASGDPSAAHAVA